MSATQHISFLKGTNTDLTPELNKAFPYLYNVRILSTNEDSSGAVTTVNGNTLVSVTLPAGTNKCIGYCENKLQGKGYAFIYNSNGTHTIYEYEEANNTITLVLQNHPSFDTNSVPLNFKVDYLITSCKVVKLDADNHLLFWTDNYVNPADNTDYNEPKCMNIERAILYMSTSGTSKDGYTTPFNAHWIDRIKEPPPAPTYKWSGLGQVTNIVNVEAELSTEWEIPSDSNTTIPFSITPINLPPPIGGQWDTVTYEWTCPADGYYGLSYGIYLILMPHTPDTGDFDEYIVALDVYKDASIFYSQSVNLYKDGSNLVYGQITNSISPYWFVAGTTISIGIRRTGYPTMGSSAVYDHVSILRTSGGSPTNITIKSLGDVLYPKINNLFKKLFQFQLDWGYKDKQSSVLSKKTDYILPKTIANIKTGYGEDFVFQDNKITITVPTGSHDVRKIRIYGHEIGMTDSADGALSDIALIIELDKDKLNIADDTTYDYIFLNDANYIPISLDKKNQLMDFVFYYEQCLEDFKNRIADANGAEGVDAVKIDLRLPVTYDQLVDEYAENRHYPKRSYLKSGGTYQYGIVYYFNGGRLGDTNTTAGQTTELQQIGVYGTRLFIPFITEQGYTSPSDYLRYIPTVFGWIYNKPPKDATGYEIVRSKNQAISSYTQFISQQMYYTDVNGQPTTTDPDKYELQIDIRNITDIYKTENGASQLVYDWTKGDRVRIIAEREDEITISAYYPFNDNETVGLFNGILAVKVSPSMPLSLDGTKQNLFEVYTPARDITNDNELVFEVGERGTIGLDTNGNAIHIPQDNGKAFTSQAFCIANHTNYSGGSIAGVEMIADSTADFTVGDDIKVVSANFNFYCTITTISSDRFDVDNVDIISGTWNGSDSAIVVKCSKQEFTSGDCFRRLTDMPYRTPPPTFIGVERLEDYTECMNASNMYNSEAWDYGRPNKIDNDAKRNVNTAMVRYSEMILPNTNINGLSTVYDVSFEEYSQQFGGFQRLFYQNERLIGFQQLKVLPILVFQQMVANPTTGVSFYSTSEKVLSKQQETGYYLQDFGIGNHPESLAFFANDKYFLDVNRAAIIRLSQDGLVDISTESGIRIFLADLCQKILKATTKVNCVGVFDVRFGEYILMVSPFTYGSNLSYAGCTIAFNEKANMFTSQYGFKGDYIGQTGVDILSFKAGKLYTHNTNSLQQNYFYGEQQSSFIGVYLNDVPEAVKVILAIKQRGLKPMSVTITSPEGQVTTINYDNFRDIENVYYSEVGRDEHTPNILASPPAPQYLPNAKFEGNPMRSRYFYCLFEYPSSEYSKWFALDLQYIISSPTLKS